MINVSCKIIAAGVEASSRGIDLFFKTNVELRQKPLSYSFEVFFKNKTHGYVSII